MLPMIEIQVPPETSYVWVSRLAGCSSESVIEVPENNIIRLQEPGIHTKDDIKLVLYGYDPESQHFINNGSTIVRIEVPSKPVGDKESFEISVPVQILDPPKQDGMLRAFLLSNGFLM